MLKTLATTDLLRARILAVPIARGLAANRLPGIPSKLTFSSHGGARHFLNVPRVAPFQRRNVALG